MTNFLKRNKHLFFIFFIVLLGLWQVSFLFYSLKWDAIDVVFPFRYYFSESFQSGYFPFWNPYLQTGTPFFADLQAPTFYPELLIVSLFTGYGVYIMQFLFVLYGFIAAVGMYQLSYQFNGNKLASFMAGISFAFSGFIIGHGQHFFLLIGAAWIPFVLKNYLQLLKESSFKQLLKTAIFVFLMVSGSYQALSFVLFYLLLLIFIGSLVNELVTKNRKNLVRILKANLYLLLISVVLLLPLILSTFEIITSVDRLNNGITLDQALKSGQSWKGIISFFLPFSTLKYDEFFGGIDASMRNHYIGLLPLLFLVLALLQKRSKKEYLLLVFGLIIFASSFQILPVREFLFKVIPLMNLFKYAAYVRVFGLLALILISANYVAGLIGNFEKEKNKLLASGAFFLLIFIVLIIYSLQKTTISDFISLMKGKTFVGMLNEMEFYQHVLIQAIFQSLIIIAFFFIILLRKTLKTPVRWIMLLIVVDMVISAQFNIGITVVDNESKPFKMKHDLALTPPNFPLPIDDKIIYNDKLHTIPTPFWRNTYNFTKQVSFGAFSSFELNSFNKLDDDYPNLRDIVLNHHLIYFSDKILPLNQFDDNKLNPDTDKDVLFLSEKDYSLLSKMNVLTDSTDSYQILEFSPNGIKIKTTTKNDQFLTMLQTNFKGWKAFIDDEIEPIYSSNFNYRTIFLPSGEHIVKFEYKNPKILFTYILSNLIFFFILLYLLAYFLRDKDFSIKTTAIILSIVFLVPALFLIKRLTYKDENKTVHQIYTERWSGKSALFSFTEDFESGVLGVDGTLAFSGQKSRYVKPENRYVDFTKFLNKELKLKSATLVVSANIYSANDAKALFVSDVTGGNSTDAWNASRIEKQIEKHDQWNQIIYQRNFFDLDEESEISIYLWNPNEIDFWIDNITVNIYPLID